jgi:hypothetical protein
VEWITRQCSQGQMLIRDLKEALGRLSFVTGILSHGRPFLGPVYSWCAACPGGACLPIPQGLALLLQWLRDKIADAPMRSCRPLRTSTGEAFRVDAKAEGDDVAIGGWETFENLDTKKARWFAIKLTRKSAAWAYARGEPFRAIASLEMMAVLIAIIVFAPGSKWAESSATVSISANTDNQGNASVLDSLMTTNHPLGSFLLEIAEQLEKFNCYLDLAWVPRLQNEEADALTNGDYHMFSAELQVKVNLDTLPFVRLPLLLKVMEQSFANIEGEKEKRKSEALEVQEQGLHKNVKRKVFLEKRAKLRLVSFLTPSVGFCLK